MDLSVLVSAGPAVLAASGSDGVDPSNIGLAFLLSGFLFYGLMRARYRNSGERHKHEAETRAEMRDMKTHDALNHSLTAVSNASMRTSNNRAVRGVNHG